MLDNLRYYAYVTLDDLAPADVPTVLYSNSDKVMPINFGQRMGSGATPQGSKMVSQVAYLPTSTYDILKFATGFTTFEEYDSAYGQNYADIYIYPLKPVRDSNTDVITHFTYDTDVGYRTDLRFKGYITTGTSSYTTTGTEEFYNWDILYRASLYDSDNSVWNNLSTSNGSGLGGGGFRSYEYYASYGTPGTSTTLITMKNMAAFMGGEDVAYNSPPYDSQRMGIRYNWRGNTGFWENTNEITCMEFYHPWWFHNGYTAEQVAAFPSYNTQTYLALYILTSSLPITDGGENYVKFNYSTSETARAVIYYTCKAIGSQGAIEVDDQEGYEILEDENSEEYNGEGDFDKGSDDIEVNDYISGPWAYMEYGPHIVKCDSANDYGHFMELFYRYIPNPVVGCKSGIEFMSVNGLSIGDIFLDICALPFKFDVNHGSNQIIELYGSGNNDGTSGIYRTVPNTIYAYNVTSQMTKQLSMGELEISEYFGNFLDYEPYTKIQIYLPFIGFRNLEPNAVMGSTIEVIYLADVITGDCVANIVVKKDKFGTRLNSLLYSFTGSCGKHYPLTQEAFYNRSIAEQQALKHIGMNVISAAGGVAGALAGGPVGAAAGGLIGSSASALMGIDPLSSVATRSGSARTGECNATSAYMASLQPYVIIDRPITAIPTGFAHNKGRELGVTKKLNTLLGFTVISDIHLDSVATMTGEDKDEMMEILRSGIII